MNMPVVHAILEAEQLDTGFVTHLIATKMGSCKLVQSFSDTTCFICFQMHIRVPILCLYVFDVFKSEWGIYVK